MNGLNESPDAVQMYTVLQAVETHLVAGAFDAALEVIEQKVPWEGLNESEEFPRLRLLAMASEIYDHAGRYDSAESIIDSEGKRCERILQKLIEFQTPSPRSHTERRLLKQQIWTVLHWGFVKFYRRSRFTEARIRFRLCWNVAERDLIVHDYRADGTLARIHYLIGLVDREVYDYNAAKHHFTESMRYTWMSLGRRDSVNRRAKLTDLNIARCLGLGLASIHYAEGQTRLAIPLLLAAKAIVSLNQDRLIGGYIDVVYASALRSNAGDQEDVLNEVLQLLYKAYKEFRKKGHTYYVMRAAHQLARAYVQRARDLKALPKVEQRTLRYAEKYAHRTMNLAKDQSDFRYTCHAQVVLSQIELQRQNAQKADAIARKALEESYDDIACRIEALLARGAARLAIGQHVEACKNVEAALDVGKDNPKVAAMCHLILARGYAYGRDLRKSSQHLNSWNHLKREINTAYLRKLEREALLARKRETDDLVINWDVETLDPKKEEARLHAFLVKWAKDRTQTDAAAIELLRISKQTFYNWQNAIGSKERMLE